MYPSPSSKCIYLRSVLSASVGLPLMQQSPLIVWSKFLLLLSRFSRVQLCETPERAAHQAPPSLGFSRQEHEWVAVSFSNAWKWKVKVKSLSHVQLCKTPWTAAYQAPLSMGFSKQEYWSGLPFPSPMHASEKSKWSCSVMSNSSRPHGLQPTRLLCPWDFPGKSTMLLLLSRFSRVRLCATP